MLDLLRHYFLVHRAGEDMGFLGCSNGEENPFCESDSRLDAQVLKSGSLQIMSHASPFASVPDEVLAKVKAYGAGLLSEWSPQQTILSSVH